MYDRPPLTTDHPPCLPLLPLLSLATLILGVAQSAQASDGAITFDLAQAPAAPLELSAVSPEAQSQAIASPSGGRQNPAIASQQQAVDLNFNLPALGAPKTVAMVEPARPLAIQATSKEEIQFSPTDLFAGGSRSLVAKAVGSAEGTRTPDGAKTPAYYGHVDPGNRAWNLGSFSYQHGADSPEEADRKQLARLQTQTEVLRQQAEAKGLELTLEEELNGIDLANQSPQAALSRGGYIDWLVEARKLGMAGSEAVTWARARSFLDPDTGRWNAPGLGNRADWIFQDQERRRAAVARAIALHQPVTVATNPDLVIQADTGSRVAEVAPLRSEANPDPVIQADTGRRVAAAAPVESTALTPDPVIQADTGNLVAQAPGLTGAIVSPQAASEGLTFNPISFKSTVAQAQRSTTVEAQREAAAVPAPERAAEPLFLADSSKTIPSWGDRHPQPVADTPMPPPFSRLSAQVSRVRSSFKAVERMRAFIPSPPVAPSPEAPPQIQEVPPASPAATFDPPPEPPAPQSREQPQQSQPDLPPDPATPQPMQPVQPRAEVADQIISIDLSNPAVPHQAAVGP